MHKKKAKVLVIGDGASGKSTLVQAYAKKNYQFSSDYNMTQGTQIYSKIIPFSQEDTDVQLFLFDTSGNQFYQSIALGMSKNPDLVMLVYDCTNGQSLKNGLKWLDKVKKLNNKSSFQGVLVGAKCQYKTAKQITSQDGKRYSQKIGLQFFQVSAAYNLHVDQPFNYLAKRVLQMGNTSIS